MSLKETQYHGIQRDKIPWFPRIDEGLCSACGGCISFCHNHVYEEREGRPVVADPYACVVGCTGCVAECPQNAISFPSLTELRDALKSLKPKPEGEAKVKPCPRK